MSKYNKTFHLPWSKGASSDDKIAKSVSSLIGVEIIITEKLDGENCVITNEGVYSKSRTAFTTAPWSKEVRGIHTNKIKNLLEPNMCVYGENMECIRSIEYGDLQSYLYIFAIRNEDEWLSWHDVEVNAFLLDIPTVPLLFKGTVTSEKELKDLTETLANKPSALGGKREGVVVRKSNSFSDKDFPNSVMKWVRDGHVQSDEHWTKKWRKAKLNWSF